MKPNVWLERIASYAVLAIAAILILFVLYQGIDMTKPLIYSKDGVSATYLVKTINETGWFSYNPWVGGVYGANWADYTMCDNGSFLLVKFFSLFSDNCFQIFNLFYFSTFVLVAWAAYAVFRVFKVSRVVGMAASLLYSFQAFHQLRLEHVWLTPYFMVPFGILVGLWLATDAFEVDALCRKTLLHNRKLIASTVLLLLSAFTGLYYAFFTCIVLCIAGVILLLRKWSVKRLLLLLYSLSAVCAGVLANVYPSFLYWMKNGLNAESELVVRGAQGAEIYALKFIQLLMPRIGHRSDRLATMARSYFDNYPLNNENQSATLGIIAGLGFLLLLVCLFRLKGDTKLVQGIKMLNAGILLTAVIGGIGGIFSYFISTPMRCYNRLSIYIAFLSLLFLSLAATSWLSRIRRKELRTLLCVAGSLAVLIIGLWDQTVSVGAGEQAAVAAESFVSDKEFVQAIEKKMPAGTKVYQMPLVKFPSGGTYELFKGYLHSRQTIWSYGGMQGREQDKWEANLLNYRLDEFLQHICFGGYRGLYLDKALMQDQGYDFSEYRQALEAELKTEPMVSKDGRLYFYDLSEYDKKLTEKLGKAEREKRDKQEYAVVVNFTDGFYERGKKDAEVSRWSERFSTVTVTYTGETPYSCTFSGTLYANSMEGGQLTITANGRKQVVSVDDKGTEIQVPLTLQKGKNVITFESSARDVTIIEEASVRNINFQIKHPKLSEDGE